MPHSTPEERAKSGITDSHSTSVGIEDIEDLLEDLDQRTGPLIRRPEAIEKVAASSLPLPIPIRRASAEGAVAFVTRPWGWVGSMPNPCL